MDYVKTYGFLLFKIKKKSHHFENLFILRFILEYNINWRILRFLRQIELANPL